MASVEFSYFSTVFAFVFEQWAAFHFGFGRWLGRNLALDTGLAGWLENPCLRRAHSAGRPTASVPCVHLYQWRVIRWQRVLLDLVRRPGCRRWYPFYVKSGMMVDHTVAGVQLGFMRKRLAAVLWRRPMQGLRGRVGGYRLSQRQHRTAVGSCPGTQVVVDRFT